MSRCGPVTEIPGEVRRALLYLARTAPRVAWSRNDPVRFPRRYAAREDREVVALVGALLAFGSARAFLPKVDALLRAMGPSPRIFIERFGPSSARAFLSSFRSRVYTGDDLRVLFRHLRAVLDEFPSLQDAFVARADGGGGPISHRSRLAAFAGRFLRLDPGPLTGSTEFSRGYRHLVADPERGSPCKRWNLFLRWMARPDDGVDLGLWTQVDPADLVIPMDLHVGRISRLVGLRRRRTVDWSAAEEVTASLRLLDARDPLRFDFPLSHLGISAGCRGKWSKPICGACPIRGICTVGEGKGR